MKTNPTILVAATERWYPAARLGMTLRDAGCGVEFVCPSGHPVGKTSAARRIHAYNGLVPLRSFARAIDRTKPDLVIPADDLAADHLHRLYSRACEQGAAGSEMRELIERSLGQAEGFKVVRERSRFLQIAREEGLRTPKTEVVAKAADLPGAIARMGFPLVLKADGTSGGYGVRVVKTLEEAEGAFHKLHRPGSLARAVKHALLDRDWTLLMPSLSRRWSTVTAQEFVAGREANSTMACFGGKVLASFHFEVVEKTNATGHATVVRTIEHTEMSAACATIAQRLKLSGLYGLDYMLDAGSGDAYLIEINARSTQAGHLALGPGHDLPAALYAAISGTEVKAAPRVTANDTIALFPQEWKRDCTSSFLSSAYHDVPWNEPELVKECINACRHEAQRTEGKSVNQAVWPEPSTPSAAVSIQAGAVKSATLAIKQ